MYYPQKRQPETLAEAVLYATYWHHDSGWHQFINGWAFGNGMATEKLIEFKSRGREAMIAWAEIETRK
ncbi:hypothetical protein AXJ18_gp082 [Streptomyces phage Jay2Jay]|uniref:Uncharacterized protein n=1 Tax=Streptomyces phage Jay2Jay TaxID=1556290 RepID=A0A0A0RQQ8_9CAUD|nr:hypothetical protein AXJ18_gp082 [Streptomyces phage Jay2Jay]AIW02692.1 hypothetical protein PBI_JAY2JAY_238 [Streptomyces phage Jay2Jay]